MRLLVASHKLCWVDSSAPSGYATDGGFASQIGALARLFDETVLCVPVAPGPAAAGLTAIDRHIVRRGGRASGERKYLRCDTCTKRRWLRVEARPPARLRHAGRRVHPGRHAGREALGVLGRDVGDGLT